MAHVDVQRITHALPDGRMLLDEVSFRASEGKVTALVGANGAGKSTLFRLISDDEPIQSGSIAVTGQMQVMPQFIGHMTHGTVRDLLLTVASPVLRAAATELEAAELAMVESEDEAAQMRYASALSGWSDAGGYDLEVVWDVITTIVLDAPFDKAQWRDVATLSGGEQKRLVLEALVRGPAEILLLDEPDNYLDVPGKVWLEGQLCESRKAVLLISHDRQLLANAADSIVTIELGAAGNFAWTHAHSFTGYHEARQARFERLEELTRRWDEEHAKLKALVLMYRTKAAYNDGLASRYQAAKTRLAKFEEAGPPQVQPRQQQVTMRLAGGRTGKRAIVCAELELRTPDGATLAAPFDLEVWFGDRVAVLGANGSGKSHFLRLLAAGGSDPEPEHLPVGGIVLEPVAHTGTAKLEPGSGRAGSRRPTPIPSGLVARCWRSCTVAMIIVPEWGARQPPVCSIGTSLPWPRSSRSTACPAASKPASKSCSSSCPARHCCCWMSPPTTWTWPRPRLSKRAWPSSRGLFSPSPTTGGSPAASIDSSCSAAMGPLHDAHDGPVWD